MTFTHKMTNAHKISVRHTLFFRHTLFLSLATLAALGLTPQSARAQTTLTAADSNVGASGMPGGGTADSNGTFVGESGSSGYNASGDNSSSFTVDGPLLTGGAGGEVTGTDPTLNYQGGDGANGLYVGANAAATINSGTFTGGTGGQVDGIGLSLAGGYGGSGLDVNASTASIYGGTFQGGDSGPATGTGDLSSGFAGSGLNANFGSTVTVFGGTFTGGDGAAVPGGNDGSAGDGLIDLSGVLNVYGGTFTGGTNGFDVDVFSGTTTLFGSDFFVNGVAAADGPLTGSGTITGLLQDNGAESTFSYRVLDGATLDLNGPAAVPEASTTVSLGLLLALGAGGVVAARKKKAGAA